MGGEIVFNNHCRGFFPPSSCLLARSPECPPAHTIPHSCSSVTTTHLPLHILPQPEKNNSHHNKRKQLEQPVPLGLPPSFSPPHTAPPPLPSEDSQASNPPQTHSEAHQLGGFWNWVLSPLMGLGDLKLPGISRNLFSCLTDHSCKTPHQLLFCGCYLRGISNTQQTIVPRF